MDYLYGKITHNQFKSTLKQMHSEIHKLLLYKDPEIEYLAFKNEEHFLIYFEKLLYRFGGLNDILFNSPYMLMLISTLHIAYEYVQCNDFQFKTFRRYILDCHGYLDIISECEVDNNAKP